MRLRTLIVPCLIVTVCTAIAAIGWYQDRPRHVIVRAKLGSYIDPSRNTGSPFLWYHAALQMRGGDVWVDVHAQVRDVRGATVRCTLEGFPNEGGTKVLTGSSPPGTGVDWTSIHIDRNTWMRSVLNLGPTYTLDYTTPRSHRWDLAFLAGPIVGVGWWAAARLRRRLADRPRGFEIVPLDADGRPMPQAGKAG